MRLHQYLAWRPGLLIKNVFGSTFWIGARVVIMGIYLVVLTRLLGPVEYGALTAAIAFATLFSPFTGLGLSQLIVLHGSRASEKVVTYWGKFIATWLSTAPILTLIIIMLWDNILSSTLSWFAIVPLVISEVFFMPLLGAVYHVLQAKDEIIPAFKIDTSIAALRLGIVILFLLLHIDSIAIFTWLYLLTTLIGLFLGLWLLRLHLENILFTTLPSINDFRDGGAFLLLDLNSRATGALDRMFLFNFQGAELVGLYSAGLRVVEAAMLPFTALIRTIAPRLFRRENGLDSGPTISILISLVVTMALGILIAVVIYILAPVLPVLLGPEWVESVNVMRWLAFLPLLYGLHHTLLTRVVGIASPGTRLRIELAGLAISITLYITLIPSLGVLGAILGQLGSHAVTTLLAGSVLLYLHQLAAQNIRPFDEK